MGIGGAQVVQYPGRTWLSLSRRLSLGEVGGTAGFPVAFWLKNKFALQPLLE